MLGSNANVMTDLTPQARAKAVFDPLDKNEDQLITQQEFVRGCLKDEDLKNLLTLSIMNTR